MKKIEKVMENYGIGNFHCLGEVKWGELLVERNAQEKNDSFPNSDELKERVITFLLENAIFGITDPHLFTQKTNLAGKLDDRIIDLLPVLTIFWNSVDGHMDFYENKWQERKYANALGEEKTGKLKKDLYKGYEIHKRFNPIQAEQEVKKKLDVWFYEEIQKIHNADLNVMKTEIVEKELSELKQLVEQLQTIVLTEK